MSPKNCSLAYDLSGEPAIDLDEGYEPQLVLLKSDDKRQTHPSYHDAAVSIRGKVTISF